MNDPLPINPSLHRLIKPRTFLDTIVPLERLLNKLQLLAFL